MFEQVLDPHFKKSFDVLVNSMANDVPPDLYLVNLKYILF